MQAIEIFSLLVLVNLQVLVLGQYEANWDSLDSRPLPEWYDKAKVGIFIHWGVYAVPALEDAWFWYNWKNNDSYLVDFMNENYPPNWTYQDFANQFGAEFNDPEFWADLFEKSGAKYVVLTSKHHDGFTLWPSNYAFSWNSVAVGPRRNLLADLLMAIRSKNLHFGLYYSLMEWYHPLYEADKANNWETSDFVDTKIIPELRELIDTYQPEVLWSDGNWEAPDTYWKSTDFLAWLFNESPVRDTVVTNDRWGSSTMCVHGDFYTCADRYNPGVLLPHKWENAMTIDGYSWGYRRNAKIEEILTAHELIVTLAQTISCGGNILINVGPTKEGIIAPVFQERLLQLGTWLGLNGEAIYESNPWSFQNDTVTPNVWYTAKEPVVYSIVLDWPENNIVRLGAATSLFNSSNTQAALLGNEDEILEWEVIDDQVAITFPNKANVQSQWAWVVKIVPN